MNFSLKSIASAVVLAVAVSGAHAAIDTGATGNGELFLNLVTAESSYVRDLGLTIDGLNTEISTAGAINRTWAADSLLTSWLSTATGPIEMSIYGVDASGQRRFVSTFAAAALVAKGADIVRNSVGAVQTKLASINPSLPGTVESATFAVGTAGYTGTNSFNDTVNTAGSSNLGFDASSAGMYEVLGMRTVFAGATGTALANYTTLADGVAPVKAYFTQDNILHIAAVPEPESYAMLLAGLGMIGFMARRRQNAA